MRFVRNSVVMQERDTLATQFEAVTQERDLFAQQIHAFEIKVAVLEALDSELKRRLGRRTVPSLSQAMATLSPIPKAAVNVLEKAWRA